MHWLRSVSRWFILSLALMLGVMVVIAPYLASEQPTDLGERVISLFAHDRVTRHTAIGCALGLTATAVIFFRAPSHPNPSTPGE